MGATVLISISLSAQPFFSHDDYEKQLSECQRRNQKLREEIAKEQATLLDLKNQIDAARKNISEIRKKKLETLGVTANDVVNASEAINALQEDISAMQSLPDDRFLQDSSRIHSFRTRLASLHSNPASRLRDLAGRLSGVADLFSQCERRLTEVLSSPEMAAADYVVKEKPAVETYTVRKLDNRYETLFSIAERFYGDPFQWPRIYQANKEIIDRNFQRYQKDTNPSKFVDPADLIFPGQVLIIPR